MGSLYKILQETFQGLRVVKAFTMEPYERRRFHDAAREYAERSIRVTRIEHRETEVMPHPSFGASTYACFQS